MRRGAHARQSSESRGYVNELTHPLAVVVDDEPAVVEVVCAVLADAGIPSRGCTNATEAFWFIGRYPPKLIILDVQMPGVDGIQIFEQLRADPSVARTPVIFLTANTHLIQRRLPHVTTRGAALLAKPFETAALLALVDEALSPGTV